MSIRLEKEETELVINHLENAENEIDAARQILSGRFEIKKKETLPTNEGKGNNNGPFKADIDVNQIQFKQKDGAIAGPYAMWGWAFALTQEGDYHEETRELVQAIEQYEKVQVGNRVYALGGREGNLLNFKRVGD